MRTCLLLTLGTVLLVFTCTASLQGLIHHGVIRFIWKPDPDFSELWSVMDARIKDPDWLLIKLGHFMGFGILGGLHVTLFRRKMLSILLTSLFAVLTEVLQLFFMRDGRIVDMGIDLGGIMLCCLLLPVSNGSLKTQKTGI